MKNRLILFLFGGVGYGLLEILWRGRTHWSMAVAGGTVMLLLHRWDRLLAERVPLPVQWVVGGLTVTAVELVAGAIVNLWLGWGVWDYRHLPLNLWGQICLPFTLLWSALMIPVIPLQRAICRRLLDEGERRQKKVATGSAALYNGR